MAAQVVRIRCDQKFEDDGRESIAVHLRFGDCSVSVRRLFSAGAITSRRQDLMTVSEMLRELARDVDAQL